MPPDSESEHDGPRQDEEQDLLVVLRLSNRQMGTNEERAGLEAFATELEEVVLEANAGEYDGDELGGGQCTLFFCGPDVEVLMAVLRPVLKHAPQARGAHFERLIEGDDGEMKRERVSI